MFGFIINHILGGLPIWFWPFMAGVGVGGRVIVGILSHFPQFKPWAFIANIICTVIVLVSVFMFGGAGVTAIYQQAIVESNNAKVEAKQESNVVNTDVSNKTKAEVKVIHDVQIVYRESIKQDAAKIDSECTIDPTAITDLNKAAKDPLGTTK